MKLGQLLAAVIYENSNPIPGRVDAPGEAKVDPQSKQVTVDFGKGPQILRQKVGDNVEFLNPQVPNSDFIAFNEAVMMLCLKCLDLPYSFAARTSRTGSGSSRRCRSTRPAAAIAASRTAIC